MLSLSTLLGNIPCSWLFMQLSNLPIMRQQCVKLCGERPGVSLTLTSNIRGEKELWYLTLTGAWLTLSISKAVDFLGFSYIMSLEFTWNWLKTRTHPVSSSSRMETLYWCEGREKWPDWLELTESLWYLRRPLCTTLYAHYFQPWGGLTTAVDKHTELPSCQPATEISGYSDTGQLIW